MSQSLQEVPLIPKENSKSWEKEDYPDFKQKSQEDNKNLNIKAKKKASRSHFESVLHDGPQVNYSLFTDPNITQNAKYAIPIVNLIVTGLFTASFICKIGSVGTVITLFNGAIQTEFLHLTDLYIITLVKLLWNGKVYPLSVMLLVFSVIWPYTKILFMGLLWFVPTSKISYKWRERILVFIDVLGKWSFFNVVLLFMLTNGLAFKGTPKAFGITIGINSYNNVQIGYYTYLTASIIQLILSHYQLHYNRQAIPIEELDEMVDNIETKDPVLDKFQEEHRIQNETSAFQTAVSEQQPILFKMNVLNIAYASLLLVYTVFAFMGLFIISMNTKTEGLLGFIIGKDAFLRYSIISIGTDYYHNQETAGMGTIYSLIYFFAIFVTAPLIMPILFGTILIFGNKIKHEYLLKILRVGEIIYAWGSIDIIGFAQIMAYLQFGTFIKFLIGNSCAGINNYLKTLKDYHLIDMNPVCLFLKTELQSGIIFLLIAGFLYIIIGIFVMRHIKNILDEKYHAPEIEEMYEKQNKHSSVSEEAQKLMI